MRDIVKRGSYVIVILTIILSCILLKIGISNEYYRPILAKIMQVYCLCVTLFYAFACTMEFKIKKKENK